MCIRDSLEDGERKRYILASRENQPAGIISTVVKMVLHFSGALNSAQIFDSLNAERAAILNVEDQLTAAICKAFPSYTPEALEELDWPTFLRRAAQAEAILMGYSLELPFQHQAEVAETGPPAAGKLDIEKMIRDSQRELGPMGGEASDGQARRAEMREARERYLRDRMSGG